MTTGWRRLLTAAATIAASTVLTIAFLTTGSPASADQHTAGRATAGAARSAAAAAPVRIRLRQAVLTLPLAAERRAGYDRRLFPTWIDADRDRCDTRKEVLIAESRVRPRLGSGCRVLAGRWYTYYDGATWTNPSDVDVNRLVAPAEAWDSGASRWTPSQRRAFANDLGDPRSLMAITDNVSAAKSDKDPVEWLPRPGTRCRYVAEWVAVKLRWRLRVDPRERQALAVLSRQCPDTVLTVNRAI